MEVPTRTELAPQIVAILRRRLLAGEWTQRLPSETELSERLQVSRPTLRAALGRLAEEGWIRARHGLGWEVVSRRKRSPTPRGPKTIGILSFAPLDQAPPLALFLIDKLQHRLGDAGWKVEVHAGSKFFLQNHRQALENLIKTSRPDLWVLFGGGTGIDEWFQDRRIPVFGVGKPREGIHRPYLDWDQRAIFRHAAGVLLARGHRHFVCLLPRFMAFGYKDPSEGFREGVERYRITTAGTPPSAAVPIASRNRHGGRSGSAVNARIVYHPGTVDGLCRVVASVFGVAPAVSSPPRSSDALPPGGKSGAPTALLVSSPRYALTAMTHLTRIGRKIPQDVSVVAVGHEPFLDNVSPSIAHYSMNREAFTRKLCRMVLQCATVGCRSTRGATVMGRFQDGESLAPPAECQSS